MFTLMFGDYEFPNQTFEVVGLPLDNKIREDVIPRRHGSIIQDPYLKSRRIRIGGFIHNSNAETSHTQLMAMQKALLAGEEAFRYRSDRYINCKTKSIKTDFKEGTDKAVIEAKIDLIASVPFLYSAGASYSDVQNPTGITTTFDVYSGGNVFSEPKILICAIGGTITDSIQLKNITNDNQLFRYRGTLANGTTLEIDVEEFTVNINDVDGLSNFEGDFITLLAGTNSFQYIGDDCRITTEYKYRWY